MSITTVNLASLTMESLVSLNRNVIAEIKRRSSQATRGFYVGQLVTFRITRTGEDVVIQIQKINHKTVQGVECYSNGKLRGWPNWRVNAAMCKPFTVKQEEEDEAIA